MTEADDDFCWQLPSLNYYGNPGILLALWFVHWAPDLAI